MKAKTHSGLFPGFTRLISMNILWSIVIPIMACATPPLEPDDWALRIEIEAGKEWVHQFPVFGPFTKPNYPTFALWITDESGNYIDTVFVTSKIGKAAWVFPDDDRPEALPLWSMLQGGQPSKENPVPDAVCGATPRQSQSFALTRGSLPDRVYVWLEINHSLDYNDFYQEGLLDPAHVFYSGGKGGSGQPALVYRVLVDFNAAAGTRSDFVLMGFSEPGGSWNGTDYYGTSLDTVTSAKSIVNSVTAILR